MDEEMRALRAELARERATSASLREGLRTAALELQASEKRVLDQIAETARAERMLQMVLGSASWRLTDPLRRAAHGIRKARS